MRTALVFALLSACVAVAAGDVYRIRFMDLATREPIVQTPVSFVPRVIIEKSADGERWGLNAQFLRKISTDKHGDILLTVAELESLTHEGGVTCDGEPDGHSGFCVNRSPNKKIQPNGQAIFTISYFTTDTRVRGLVYLDKNDVNHVWLDRRDKKTE